MLQYHMSTKLQNRYPIRKAHKVGGSIVVTIDPMHVKRLAIDDFTFFEQKPSSNGILLTKYRLNIDSEANNNSV